MKSPFFPVGLSVAALLASLSRWFVQDSGNLYTALEKRFYIPDPNLGWRVSAAHPVWIGVDACAVVAALAIGLTIGGYVVRLRESRRSIRSSFLRAAAWTLGAIALLVPLAAFASGSRPSGGIDGLPLDVAPPLARNAIAGELDAPAGRYEVVQHEGTSITARLSAGGETFDARFAGDVEGFWRGDPHDLASPTTAMGPFPDLDSPKREVRFAAINGHHQLSAVRPIGANDGLMRCSKTLLFSASL